MDKGRITYGLPYEIEDLLLNGTSTSNCKKLLKEFPEYQNKTSKELQEILVTAHTYLMAEKTARDFEDDFEYYKISPVVDSKTCSHCKDISKAKFKFADRIPGKNFPPFHPGCRCSFVVAEPEDWDKWEDEYVKRHSKKSFLNVFKRRTPP